MIETHLVADLEREGCRRAGHDRPGPGRYDAAQARYEQALTINERLGNQADMANGYHQLGNVAHLRGDYDTAQARYEQYLTVTERLGDQAGMDTVYHELGNVAHLRSDAYYALALVIRAPLGIPTAQNNAVSLRQLHQEFGETRMLALVTDAVGADAGGQILDILTAATCEDSSQSPETQ
jgi:tetratricopeptide (TPR) repeat protein